METDYVPFDLWRMFFGQHPPLYYLEIVVRVAVVYFYTLMMVRWVGGRGIAQLSLVEFLLVIALGSAVGDSVLYPDVPIMIALAVVTVVIVINKVLDLAIARWPRSKIIIDGRPVALVRDGVLVVEGLRARDFGTNEVMALLRGAGISNLGQVEHAYLEVGGAVSVFRAEPARAGLAIIPPPDVIPPEGLTDVTLAPRGLVCCAVCGLLARAAEVLPDHDCDNCGDRIWVAPIIPPLAETTAPT